MDATLRGSLELQALDKIEGKRWEQNTVVTMVVDDEDNHYEAVCKRENEHEPFYVESIEYRGWFGLF